MALWFHRWMPHGLVRWALGLLLLMAGILTKPSFGVRSEALGNMLRKRLALAKSGMGASVRVQTRSGSIHDPVWNERRSITDKLLHFSGDAG